ncbi:MAG: dTDP-4-dehydrorhamnose reductase [Verrucomicrobiae bacterium]|nr:dTDP-4-dehydrorhamnose reductase [Verrucomicrobiae bacterium]
MSRLVLGAGGILGGALVRHYAALGMPCVAAPHAALDLCDTPALEAVLDRDRPACVFNAAALTAVDRCETERERAFEVNAAAPARAAAACRARGLRFVHVSTDYVFDGARRRPYREDDLARPLSVYGASKLEGERRVLAEDPSALVVRVAWVFDRGGRTFLCRLRKMIASDETLRVANDRIGNCTYASDLATALEALVARRAEGLMHFSNRGELSWFDFAAALVEEAHRLGLPVRCRAIEPISSASLGLPARRPPYSVLDTARYETLTGHAVRPWRETLLDFLRESRD